MRIYLDESELILKQLKLLFFELPMDLRSQKSLIPASDLIVEAIEYISLLKTENVLKNLTSKNSSEINRSKQPSGTNGISLIQPTIKTISQAQSKFKSPVNAYISVATSSPNSQPQSQVRPMSVDVRVTSSTSLSMSRLNTVVAGRGTSLLKKPITIVTRDSAGNEKPVTILPKAREGNASFIKLSNACTLRSVPEAMMSKTQMSHGVVCPEGCKCKNSLDDIPLPERVKEKLVQFISSRIKILPRDSETVLTYNWIQEGVIEKLFSLCKRKDFFKFCRVIRSESDISYEQAENESCIVLDKTEWEDPTRRGCVRINGKLYCLPLLLVKLFRDGFGEHALSRLSLVSRGDCALSLGSVSRASSLCINPDHYIHEIQRDKIVSPHQCSLRLRADTNGVKVVCVLCQTVQANQEGAESSATKLAVTQPQQKIRIVTTTTPSSQNKTKISFIEEPTVTAVNTVDAADEIQIKEERPEDDSADYDGEDVSDTNFNAMEDEFTSMLRSFEQSIDEEARLTTTTEPVVTLKDKSESREVDNEKIEEPGVVPEKEALKSDESSPKIVSVHQISDEAVSPESSLQNTKVHIVVLNNPNDKIRDIKHIQIKRKSSCLENTEQTLAEGKNFQCWKCVDWFESKESLADHPCLLKMCHADVFYSCLFCGLSSDDLDSVRTHVSRCKEFGLAPLKALQEFKSVTDLANDALLTNLVSESKMTESPISEVLSASRSKRHKKNESSKCEQCGVTFTSNTELVLHLGKIKCKSVHCEACDQFFASAWSFEKHNCTKSKLSPGSDSDIVVVNNQKSNPGEQPVKCQYCEMVLQSLKILDYHQTVAVGCAKCGDKFQNCCKLFRHQCTIRTQTSRETRTKVFNSPVHLKVKTPDKKFVVLQKISRNEKSPSAVRVSNRVRTPTVKIHPAHIPSEELSPKGLKS